MIDRNTFDKLRRGDIILWGNNMKPRIILLGPADKTLSPRNPKHSNIELSYVSRNSWLFKADPKVHMHATYDYYSCKDKINIPSVPLDLRAWRKLEMERLKSFGMNTPKATRRIFTEFKRLREIGFTHCVPDCRPKSHSIWPTHGHSTHKLIEASQ
jgi:hypothetical protein